MTLCIPRRASEEFISKGYYLENEKKFTNQGRAGRGLEGIGFGKRTSGQTKKFGGLGRGIQWRWY